MVVIASDSFKGTLSSLDICKLFKEKFSDAICLPIADGGEGSLEAISNILEGRFIDVEVTDLYFKKIKTKFYLDNHYNAYIESASCVGLNLAKPDNDPGQVTTFGVGEQILEAIKAGAQNIYVFLGGTASNDGGCGLTSALGVKFFNKDNELFTPTGLTLKNIDYIDDFFAKETLKGINIIMLSDVKSPFYGVEGAAYKFAKQKGASDEEIKILDDGLKHLSNLIFQNLNIDVSKIPGSGAAGGLGGGLLAFANASVASGIETILDLANFDEVIKSADYVISGEGKLDKQTLDGKVIDGVSHRCLKMNKPLILIVGISDMSLEEIQQIYPCVSHLYETNDEHLPFEQVKKTAKEDYLKTIKKLDSILQ